MTQLVRCNNYLPAFVASCMFLTGCAPEAYRDVRPAHWAWWGADTEIVDSVIEQVRERASDGEYWDTATPYGPGSWTFEFLQMAIQTKISAEILESERDLSGASRRYHEASVYYGLAKYPHIERSEAENVSLQGQLLSYRKSFELLGYGYELIETDLDGEKVTGLLHLPRSNFQPPFPVVIGTNGLDVFAAESGPLVTDLLNQGIAVLMSDIPGTGFNSGIPLTPDFHRLWLTFLIELQANPLVNTTNAGAFGMSFGGNAVVKLAMTAPESFRAIANICGPVHEVFTLSEDEVSAIDAMYLDGLADRMHLPDKRPSTVVAAARGFSLVNQGLIGQGQSTKVPVLSMNARGDYVAPEPDLELVTQASEGGRIVWSGSGDHCPQDRKRDMPLVAEFFVSHLLNTTYGTNK
jgi:esterase FrsA